MDKRVIQSAPSRSRATTDLLIAFGIGILLLLVNVSINFAGWIQSFFGAYDRTPLAYVLINGLFIWLAGLLLIAFRRWRVETRRRSELEDIITSISPDALLVVSPELEILVSNGSVQRMFGYEPADVIGRTTDALYFDRRVRRDQPHEIYDALARDGFHIGEATGRRLDGTTFALEIISAELSAGTGAVLLLRDITDRKRAEAERLRLETRMRQQQKRESLGVLAGGVAHDFNNLLTVVRGNAEILGRELPKDAAGQEFIEGILSAADRASALCRQMLDFAGENTVDTKHVDLGDVASKTTHLVRVSVPHQIRLECELAPSLPPIEADVVQLQQVLMNLVMNGAEAIGEDPGTITVSTGVREFDEAALQRYSVAQAPDPGRYVYAEVADTGCGMDEAARQRIFDPFFTTKETGRGLGLASVLGVIHAHRWALLLESEVNRGSCFTVLIPPLEPGPVP